MDDNDKKNIDGIKPSLQPENTDKSVNNIKVTSEESTIPEDHTVTINTDGDMANQDTVAQEEAPITEDSTPVEEAPISEEPSPVEDTPDESPEAHINEPPVNDVPEITTPAAVQTAINQQTQPSSAETEVVKLKERNKHLRIWLAILVVLLVGLASALVVYFAQQSKAQSDLDAANQENAALQEQINQQSNNATQAKVTDLQTQLDAEKAKNAELTAENKQLSETVAAYEKSTAKLLELCGDKCSTVTIPDSTTTQTTPTN